MARILSPSEFAEHGPEADDPWICIRVSGEETARVYDLSKWFPCHPGGPSLILKEFGKDGTAAFFEKARHDQNHLDYLRPYLVGNLRGVTEGEGKQREAGEAASAMRMASSYACDRCGTTDPPPAKVCSQCKRAHYCDKFCQASGWKEHKKVCIKVGKLF